MADDRIFLQSALEEVFPDLNVVYNPPGDVILQRPCIVYTTKQLDATYANNTTYSIGTRFQVTILSDLPGYSNIRNVYSMTGVTISSHQSYTTQDVVHDVFEVLVNII